MPVMASTPPKAADTGLPTWLRRLMQMVGAAFIVAAPLLHAGGIARGSTAYLLTAGAALLLFSVLDRIEAFSAWGLSAKLRAVEKAAQEAAASAEEMRALALTVVRMTLFLAHAGGRWDGNQRARLIADSEAKRLLQTLHASEEERREVYRDADAIALYDLEGGVYEAVLKAFPNGLPAEVEQAVRLREERWNQGLPALLSTDLRLWVANLRALTPEVEVALHKLAAAEERLARGDRS